MAKLKLRVFLSSPGDVGDERRMALRVMERLQGEFAALLQLEPIVWEHEPVRATSTFQQQIPEPAKSDVLICVLWSRLGTRLPQDFTRSDGSVYDSGTAYELETALDAFKDHGHPDILVYRKTAAPLFDVSNRDERELRSRQWDQLSDYLKRWFFNPDGSFKAGFSQFSRLDEFEDQLERHLRRLLEERLKEENIQIGGAPQALPTWLKGSPFRGLAAFDVEHAEIFHGRTRGIAEAKDRLTRRAQAHKREDGTVEPGTAFLLITGMSGSGKSSLARAGLIPAITTPGAVEGIGLWRHAIFRPAEAADPILALVQRLYGRGALPELAQGDFTPESLADLLGRMPQQGLAPIRRALERASERLMQQEGLTKAPTARLLILVDQLEELFTDERFGKEQREAFARALDVLARSGFVWVVATLRSDFYHRCQELPVLAELKDGTGTYDLLPPQGPEIAQMIRNPARAAGLHFEESASEGGLDDVLQQAAARSPTSLPLLSFVLDELYAASGETRRLTFGAYQALGGLEGAIAKRADDVVNALPPPVQQALPALLRALITLDRDDGVATARSVLRSQAVHTPQAEALVRALVDARLLVTGGEGDNTVLRVAHEALLTRWPRAREIITENREFLQARARLQTDGDRWLREGRNPEDLLPSGKRLVEAREVLLARRDELDPELAAYIDASVAAKVARDQAKQAEAKRKLRRTQMAAAIGLILAVLAGVGAYFGFAGQAEAERQTLVAEREAEAARAAEKVADEQRQIAETEAEAALAAEKVADEQREIAETEAEAARAAEKVADEQRQLAQREAEAARAAEAIADQQRQIAVEQQSLAEQREAEAQAALREVLRFQSKTLALESRRQTAAGNAILGELLALEGLPKPGEGTGDRPYVAEAEAALKVALAAQNGLVTYSHYESIRSMAMSPDGKSMVTASEDRTARVWDLYEGVERLILKGHTKTVVSVAFSLDLRLLATGSEDGTARVWDAVTGKQLLVLEGSEGTIWEVQFSPDSSKLLTYAQDNVQRIWDTKNGAQLVTFGQHTGEIMRATFSPDGTMVASASLDGYVDIWDPANGRLLAQVGGDYTGGMEWVEWDAAGERIITADRGDAAEVWNASGTFLFGLYGRHSNWVTRASFSRDGKYIATGDYDGKVHLWNGQTGDHLFPLDGHGCKTDTDGTPLCVIWETAFSPDSRYLATLGRDATVRIWDVASYEDLDVISQGGVTISDIAFTPDSSKLVTATWDGTARLWEIESGPAKAVMGRRSLWMTEAAFSPDGKEIAVGSGNEGVLMRFSTADGAWIDTLPYHINEITHLEYSADGKRLLSSAYDFTAAVWKLDALETEDEEVYAMTAVFHDREVLDADFSADGKLFVTASIDGTAKIVETETGTVLFVLQGHSDRINTARFDPAAKRVVTASDDGTAIVWDAATGRQLFPLRLHRGWVNHAEFSADGSKVLTASSDGQVGLWNAESGRMIRAFRAFDKNVWHASISRDGTRVAAAGPSGGVLFDANSGQELARLPHDFGTYLAQFSPDGLRVLTVDEGGKGAVWSATDGKLIVELVGHTAPIYYGTWSNDSSTIATVSEDGTTRLWNPLSGETIQTIENPRDEFWDVSFSPDGKWVIGGGYVNLNVWDVDTGKREWLLTGHRKHLVRALFSPDGTRVISASLDGTAILRETENFDEVSTISHWNAVYDAQFSADSARLVTVDQKGQVAVWDGKTADLISLLEGHTDRVNSGRFDPTDNTRLVTGSDDTTAIVWDTTTGTALLTLKGHSGWVNEAIYSPDGKLIATASADGTARLWDAKTGREVAVLEGHLKELWDAAFSPDGRTLATASSDGTARVWDVTTGKQIYALPSPAAGVNRVTYSPEGDHIVTVSDDRIARVWDAATGILVTTLEGHTDSIIDVEFSPDGRELVTGGFDGRARLWRVYTGTQLVDMARTTVPRELTDAERERFGLTQPEAGGSAAAQQ